MHILNRRRFFYVVLGLLCMHVALGSPTNANYAKAAKPNEPGPVIRSPESNTELSDEAILIEAMQVEGYQVETVVATGYTAGIESTGKYPSDEAYGITYAGIPVKRDVYSTIAADLETYPLGTILYIPGYGYGVVTDIGSAIQGNKIDLYYETVDDVYNDWGKQTVDVYVVRVGNGSITEEELNRLNENANGQQMVHTLKKTDP